MDGIGCLRLRKQRNKAHIRQLQKDLTNTIAPIDEAGVTDV
jgi:hypothetical protein